MGRRMDVVAVGVGPALGAGMVVMRASGAPWSLPLLNLSAALLGLVIVRVSGALRPMAVAATVLGFEALTFASPGVDGVQRWIPIAGLHLHAGAIGDPLLLLSCLLLWRHERAWTAISFIFPGLGLHIAQPDAAQASALAAGTVTFALLAGAKYGRVTAALACAGAALAWLRPDPLPPADLVENIVPRAFALHPALGGLCLVTLGVLPGVAWVAARSNSEDCEQRALCLGMGAYLLAQIAAGAFGEFPTPVLGFGASHVLGTTRGLGLMMRSSLKALR